MDCAGVTTVAGGDRAWRPRTEAVMAVNIRSWTITTCLIGPRYSFHHFGTIAHLVIGRLIDCRGDRFAESCDVMRHQRCGIAS
jgi:hypothetical protein